MICPFDIESYRNHIGDLRIGLRHKPTEGYFRVLTRSEALMLRDALSAALESHDEHEAHARMTDAYRGDR